MKQFNLEEYLKNPSRKVVTRDGRSVRIVCTDYYADKPIIAKIEGCEHSYPFYEDGGFFTYGGSSISDLFFAPEKHEGWLNVYRHTDTKEVTFGAILHTSREEAEEMGRADGYYVATAKIEWEE